VRGRVERLQRLAAIRMMTEELDRNVLRAARGAVAEVETAIDTQNSALAESKANARAALSGGDRGEWMMADAQGEVAGWNRAKLAGYLVARTEAATAAMDKVLESRREHEQVKLLVKNARVAARVEDVRRTQAAVDEWFLSKRLPEVE
jgi:hypothetical protein